MKKFMALALAAIMLVTFAACAMAETAFEFRASCTDTNAIAYDTNGAHQEYKTKNNHQVYVRHWVIGGSDQWATIGLKVPIQSNSITNYVSYTMAGRGNTNHYDYDGVSTVTLHGNFDTNL